ncbi:hypothetical protein CQJ94_00655 [Glycomyces fuscus]|nr:hypothetical protein CQJ94_00655 [Glycomyces fuscus]
MKREPVILVSADEVVHHVGGLQDSEFLLGVERDVGGHLPGPEWAELGVETPDRFKVDRVEFEGVLPVG